MPARRTARASFSSDVRVGSWSTPASAGAVSWAKERAASLRFPSQVLQPDKDRAFVIPFDQAVELLQDLTSSREKLGEALGHLATLRRQPGKQLVARQNGAERFGAADFGGSDPKGRSQAKPARQKSASFC